MLTTRLSAACPPRLHSAIGRYLARESSGEIALMQCILQLGGTGLLVPILEGLTAAAPERDEICDLLQLARTNTQNLAQVTALLEAGLVSFPPPGDDGIAATRKQFDRAVAAAPEAAVALYSLGSAAILERATAEIVARLAEWELLGSDRAVLDIGCGIGRLERALAPHVGAITGIDVSPGMISEARVRCRGLPNVKLQLCEGRDLSAFGDQSLDLVLAVDSFPCMVAVNVAIAERHIKDAARLLRSRGTLLILNYSYRSDIEVDRQDMAALASMNGFVLRRFGTRDLILWDGVTFLLTR
jgi:SAM-dependent methyltransferase